MITRRLRNLAVREDGMALVMVLGIILIFSITVVTATNIVRSMQSTTGSSTAQQSALALAEAGINSAVATLYSQNTSTGNPIAAYLFGCQGATGPADVQGPSNCATYTPVTYCISAAAGCSAASAGSANVVGYFAGTLNPGTWNGITVAANTWLLQSTGYVANPNGSGTLSRTMYASVLITPLGAGGVASLWNHIFITSPLVANVCQFDISGSNGVTLNVPIYTVGNVCLGTNSIQEVGGNKIDLEIGGKLVIAGGSVGTNAAKITSGVVSGGCTTVAVTSTTSPCDNGTFNYFVTTKDNFIAQAAPEQSNADITNDYNNFDPGPKHACQAGNHPNAPLASTTFESAGSTVPDGTAAAFNLTPSSSYSCISASGASTGELSWNNSTNVLTVTGSVFIDGAVNITKPFTYTSTGILEAYGKITFTGNNDAHCAVANCSTTTWQGTSGNNQMLTLASVIPNTAGAITFQDNSQSFQGSLWCQPSSSLNIVKNTTHIQGPMSVGTFTAGFNGGALYPLPVIKNMPANAPIPPNSNITIYPPVFLK